MRKLYPIFALLILLISTAINVFAQCDPLLRPDSSQWIFNGRINATANVGNTLYLGGTFTTLSKATGNLAVLSANNGNPQMTGAWPKANGPISAIIADGSAGWIICGTFTQVGSSARNRIAQINSSGQVTSWNPNASGTVNTLYRVGTTVYAGGTFSSIGGQTRNNIAALSLSTGLATSWNPNSGGNINTIIANGTGTVVYAGGSFSTIGGQTRNNIAALDATTGLATSWNPNANSTIYAIALSGTTAFVGGAFTNIGGQTRNNAGAVSTTTGLATSWNPAPNGPVFAFALNGSNIVAGGTFTTIGSQTRNRLGEVDQNLGNATAFNIPFTASSIVSSLRVSGTMLYVGGNFTTSGTGQANLVKVNLANNTINQQWEANTDAAVNAIDVSGTTVYAGGAFNTVSKNRSYLAAIDLVTDSILTWNPRANGFVNALAADATTIYAGGLFTAVGGQTRNRFAAMEAASGNVTAMNPAPNNNVNALVLSGTTLYVGGAFTSIAASTRNRLAAINTATGAALTWNPNADGAVHAMLLSGTTLYLGGAFTIVNSQTRNRIAAVDASSGSVTSWNPNADGNVNTLANTGLAIIAGGSFNNIGSQFVPRLASLSISTGLASNTWIPYPNGPVNSILLNGNRLYVGGSFGLIGGQSRTFLAALELGTGLATNWNPAANSIVWHISSYNGRLFVGGDFTNISGQTATPNVAQYNLFEVAPFVTISGNDNVCASTATTFTASTNVVGASYQWKRNGVNAGTNSATYTVVPVNGDQIQCVVTTSNSCYTATTGTSNTITVTVSSAVTPTASISGPTIVCATSPGTYVATTNIVNANYQWKVNGQDIGTNNPVLSYIPANGDIVSVVVSRSANGCYTASSVTSNTINVTVNVTGPANISISTPNTTVCAGFPITFTATSANIVGGTYQWKVNNVNVGTNSSTYITSTLTNGAQVTCVITAPLGYPCLTTTTATSNTIIMTVNPTTVPTLSIAGNNNPCASTSVTFTATTNVTTPTYQWKRNGLNVGTNSATYALVPANGDVISCVVTTPSNICYSTPTVTSNNLTITIATPVTPTVTISGPTPACSGMSNTYTAATPITGASYQWRRNGLNVGTNSATYSVVPNAGDQIQCVITVPGVGCFTTNTSTSNTITVTLTNPVVPTAAISTANTNVCSGSSVNFTATTNITGATYQWKVNGSNAGTNSPAFNIPAIATSVSTVTCEISTPSGSCYTIPVVTSNTLNMNVTATAAPFASITTIPAALCANQAVSSSGFSAISNIATGATYQWQVNGVNMPTPYYPVNGDVVTVIVTAPAGSCYTPQSATSAPVILNVGAPVTPTVTTTASANPSCQSHPVNYTATTAITGATYQWKVNGQNVGTNMPTYSYAPADDDIVLCTITTPPGCFTSTFAISTLILMDVKPATTTVLTISAPPLAEEGSTVIVTADIPAGVTAYSIDWKNKGVTFATTTTASTTYMKTAGIDTITAVITPTNDCYAVATSQTVYVYSVGTGVSNIAKAGIEVFPNPFSNLIRVKGLEKGDKLTISDVVGREIGLPYFIEKQENEYMIQLSDIIPGTYILRIQDKDGNVKANFNLRKL